MGWAAGAADMKKENINLVLGILIVIGLLVQLAWSIWESLENKKHCAEFGIRVEASRVEHMKKLGCVAIMPDGRMLAEPK
jgi:hypothetical protein